MNYLKKKINKAKLANKNHDDDDVYDYIPAVPLHPSELARKEALEAAELNGLSEEEKQARLEAKRQLLEDKKRQQEEAKKGQEAWKFFEQLNLRVTDTVTKSQSVIDNLKDSTTADELIKAAEEELGFAVADSDEEEPQKGATFSKGAWVAFAEGSGIDDDIKSPVAEAIKSPITPQVPLSNTILEPEEVIPDEELLSGFIPNSTYTPPEVEEGDDPFDTSYVSVSVVEAKQAARLIASSSSTLETNKPQASSNTDSSNLSVTVNGSDKEYTLINTVNLDLESLDVKKPSPDLPTTPAVNLPPGSPVPDPDFDPDIADLYLQQTSKKIHHVSRYGSTTSLASILSNPFLNEDFTDDYNTGGQSNISSGAATPTKRRGSTNPFEEPSSEEEEPPGDQATAIAALTADFCSAIESNEEEKVMADKTSVETESPVPDVKQEEVEESSIRTDPPPPPPSTEPFDPFATISDDTHEPEGSDHQHTHLNPAKLPDYPSDVSDTEDPELARVTEVSCEDKVGDEVPEDEVVVETKVERRRSSAFKDKDSPSKRSSASSLEVNNRRGSKPFDPFQQVDEAVTPVVEERDGRSFEPRSEDETEQKEESKKSEEDIANPESGIVNEAFEDYPPPDKEEINYDEDIFPAPKEMEVPDFSDPNIDPFDTSTFSFDKVADAVGVTDGEVFDEFSSRFDKTTGKGGNASLDAFSSPLPQRKGVKEGDGFDSGFDPFSGVRPPTSTPIKMKKEDSKDSFSDDDEEEHFKIVIKAKMRDPVKSSGGDLPVPLLPPPPKTPVKTREKAEFDEYDFINRKLAKKEERDREAAEAERTFNETLAADREKRLAEQSAIPALGESAVKRTDSQDSASTPLYDEDVSQPLEDFPPRYQGQGWEMFIRYPAKKKLTGNRFWKKIFVRVSENSVVQLFNTKEDTDPFQELPLQPSYSLSEISAQQYDQFGKIFTVKLQYVFYRERVGVRKGQIAKVIQGQITSIGSIAKLGMPLDHAPQISELIKLGTHNYNDARDLQQVVEEALFRMPLVRDRALTYKTEEIQITVQDDYYVEQNRMGIIQKQLARVRLFFIAFLNGMPGVEIGVNDMTRQGKEIVGRYDIIPVVTEEWIRLENYEFHSCVMLEEFEKTRTIKLIPPDACYFELMRFRVRPPKNRELPLQVSCNLYVTKRKVELRCEVLVPGAISRKHGQIPCEDIVIRVHIPECWIYFFRTEKHMRYGAVKSTARRPGKLKVNDVFFRGFYLELI